MRRVAVNLLHPSGHYRREKYARGLERVGYSVNYDKFHNPRPVDLLLVWNRNPAHNSIAVKFEAVGATVVVTENGYIGDTKALAVGHHSGAGTWNVGTEDRWIDLNREVKPWRTTGDEVLILPQRSIGETGIAMPRNWEKTALAKIRRFTDRPVRVRKHPGKDRVALPIEEDLKNAWCALTWASGAGIKCICEGVPVFYELEKWIGSGAASCNLDIEKPYRGDRLETLNRLAYAQWSMNEIESGKAFDFLLNNKQ